MKSSALSSPVVMLAPHATHPPMDGASCRSWALALEWAAEAGSCLYLAKSHVLRLERGGRYTVIRAMSGGRLKLASAARAAVRGSHYLVERHLPERWLAAAREIVQEAHCECLYVHFLWAWDPAWAAAGARRIFVDTHNFDPEWWTNLAAKSNWLSRRICAASLDYALRMLRELPPQVSLVHVSEKDAERYRALRSGVHHLVVANGCEVQPRPSAPDYADVPKQLYFLGSLNLQITAEALDRLAERFWPALREIAQLQVFGSGESRHVEQLCQRWGWKLHRNLPEEELSRRLGEMHYLVLPFGYSAGSKLKFPHACGRGIPVISTPAGVSGFAELPATALVSDDPEKWREHIADHAAPSEAELADCLRFAETYSWPAVCRAGGLFDPAPVR